MIDAFVITDANCQELIKRVKDGNEISEEDKAKFGASTLKELEKIEKFIINELSNVLEIMKEDNIDILNVNFLNEARGKLKFDINYKDIEIICKKYLHITFFISSI